MWVVSVPFCTVQYISDARFLTGDEKSRDRKRLTSKVAKVAFKCAASRFRADYRRQEMLYVFTLRKIKAGEELLIGYGMRYSF